VKKSILWSSLFIGLGVFGATFMSPISELQASPSEQSMVDASELSCLALNIYFESRNQGTAGKVAVANVTLNRVDSPKFPDTVCGVVQQGPVSKWHLENTGKKVPVRNKCQFSWWCDGKSDIPREDAVWEKSQWVAYDVYMQWLDKKMLDITDDSLYYHANYVTPYWAKSMVHATTIADHLFYRQEQEIQ
jgi:spore germination cell wall hydrolase CwlJ-like protein